MSREGYDQFKHRMKRLLGNFFQPNHIDSSRRLILIYHAVGNGPLAQVVNLFHAQVEWLLEHAQVVSLDSLLASSSASQSLQVALTFDDGYRCLHRYVAPILNSYNLPATVYLTTAQISNDRPRFSNQSLGHYPGEEFLTWNEVADLFAQGWTIGSHGREHLDLTTLPEGELSDQLSISRDDIENRFGRPCRHFSYPWGRHNPVIEQVVREAGYAFAVAGNHAPLRADSNLLALPRIDIRREYDLNDFAAVVTGRWDYLGLLQRMRR